MENIKAENSAPENKTRIQALAERVIAECQRQNFKVGEVELLLDALSLALEQRIYRFKFDLF